jgi:hypothetical protein
MNLKRALCAVPACAFTGFWILGWTTITLIFDVLTVQSALSQMGTARYAPGEARITQVWTEGCGEDKIHKLEYVYAVDGHEYTGTRYRLGNGSHSGSSAGATIEALSAGQRVMVYYDPLRPAEAVLCQGLQGEDLFSFLFMTPFNVIMVGAWVLAAKALARILSDKEADWPCQREGPVTRARMALVTPWQAAGIALGAAAFALVFILGMPFGFAPTMGVMIGAWAAMLTLAGTAYAVTAQRQRTGECDLVIDAESVTLPRGGGRSEPRRIARPALEAVTVQEKDENQQALVLWRGPAGELEVETILDGHSTEETQRFAAWLRKELGLRPRAARLSRMHA